MYRTSGIALSAIVLLAACKVERTPRKFYSQRDPAAAERATALEELRSRVISVGAALDRGDADGAALALAPAVDLYVVGPGGGAPGVGAEGMARLFRPLTDSVDAAIQVRDVRVTLDPRAQVGWFAAGIEVVRSDSTAPIDTVSFTGVYLRSRGVWQLAQAHLSGRPMHPAPPQSSPPADSTARGGDTARAAPATSPASTSGRSPRPAGTRAAPRRRSGT